MRLLRYQGRLLGYSGWLLRCCCAVSRVSGNTLVLSQSVSAAKMKLPNAGTDSISTEDVPLIEKCTYTDYIIREDLFFYFNWFSSFLQIYFLCL